MVVDMENRFEEHPTGHHAAGYVDGKEEKNNNPGYQLENKLIVL